MEKPSLSSPSQHWLLAGSPATFEAISKAEEHTSLRWQGMCLTGVVDLSTLGHAPGIAVLAATLLRISHFQFGWTAGNPVQYLLRFLLCGEGDIAPVTSEILRRAESNPARRPSVHVGR